MSPVKKPKNGNISKLYPSDLTNGQWKKVAGLLPAPKKQQGQVGRNPVELALVLNAIFYVLRSGCAWRMLPKDYPKWQTCYGYFNRWSKAGVWQKVHIRLVKQVRKKTKRKKRPSAAIIDSQSVKTTLGGWISYWL